MGQSRRLGRASYPVDNDLVERDDIFKALGVATVCGEGDPGRAEDAPDEPESTTTSDSHAMNAIGREPR